MPGKVKARVLAARNLPVMDRSSDTTDAFAEVRFGSEFYKTDICRKSLNPVWNSDWFRFDVDDRELQDEPLHIRIMDYDTYSANDAIGKVYIDLNPLLLKAEDDRTNHAVLLSGWLPIFDTMHGVRGEVNVQVKVELFSDLNKFRTSSCGVKFYIASSIPEGYRVQFINGFVQRLLTTNDPEYQWIDRIRTPRASNEARQALFMKLSSTVQRKIGLMALELGANAVLGYQQKFDLEGESIVVRGIGTAVTLVKQVESILNNEPTIHKERRPSGQTMAFLQNEHSSQNMSESFSLENEEAEVPVVQTQPKSSNKNIVSSLTAVAANIGRQATSSIPIPSTKNTWLNRKSSFKAAARSKRSISMTTMAAGSGFGGAGSGAPKSPQTHHRVSSVKSAKAAINRGGASSSNLGIASSNKPRARSSNSFNAGESLPVAGGACGPPGGDGAGMIPPMNMMTVGGGDIVKNSSTNSSLCTTDPDITSSSIPALEGGGDAGIIATFDLSYDDSIIDADEEDVDVDDYYAMDGGSEEEEGDGGSVFSSQNQLHHHHSISSISSSNVNEEFTKEYHYEEKGASCNSTSSCVIPKIMSPDNADYEYDEENLGAFKDETKWAQEALKQRREKGRTDSTSTNEVTYINTILNKNRDMTAGEHIRRRILDESEQPCSSNSNSRMTSGSGHHPQQVSDDNSSAPGSILDTPEPPILTIEPPSPMPGNMSTCTSPYRLRTTSDDTDDTDHRYRTTCTTSDEDETKECEITNVMQPIGSSQNTQNNHPPSAAAGGSNIGGANINKPKSARRKFAIRSSSARYNRKLSITNTQTTVEFRAAAARNLNILNPAPASQSASSSSSSNIRRASSEPKRTSEVASQTSLLVADDNTKRDSASAKNTKNNNTNTVNLETPDYSLTSTTNHPIPSYIHRSNEFISSTGGSRHASGEKESEGGYSPKGSGFTHNPVQSTMSTPAVLPSSKFTLKPGMLREGLEVLEYPFLTLHTFPEGFIQRIGGLVSCRSVKLLEGELEDNKTLRESWWEELRKEIRSHARCLGCNLVVGYSEDTAIWEDCIVLSSRGTAAYGNLQFMLDLDTIGTMYGPPFMTTNNNAKIPSKSSTTSGSAGVHENFREVDLTEKSGCSLVHLPATSEIPATYAHRCNICGKNPVPDILFTTIEPLVNQLTIVGRGCVIQAKVLRTKKDMKGESNAKEISDSLPFIEYELHRQLYNKLKVKGMNAIFGLKTSFSMSDRLMVATATGTGVFLAALSPPSPPRLVMTPATAIHHKDDQDYLHRMQKRLEEKISENIIYHGLNDVSKSRNSSASEDNEAGEVDPATSASAMDYDLLMGNKDTCVLEIDDSEDADILDSIMDRFPPSGIQTFSTEELIGIASGHIVRTSQMFTHVWRGRIQPHTKDLTKVCQRSMASVYYKLRRLKPCLIGNVFLKVDIDEENDLQCSISGIAISLAHDGKTRGELAYELTTMDNSEAEDESVKDLNDITSDLIDKKMTSSTKRNVFFVESKEPEGIVLTPQSYIPGAKNEKYLGNLNFFLIRETSSLREAGGLSNFVQSFVCEIHAIVRAHVAALGGNALISYFLSEFVVMHNPHKNQAQCLIHVGGDSVQVTYFPLS